MLRKKHGATTAPSLENSASVEYLVLLCELDLLKGMNSLAPTLRMLKVIEVFAKNRIGLFQGTNSRAQGLSEILCICECIWRWLNPGTNDCALGFNFNEKLND